MICPVWGVLRVYVDWPPGRNCPNRPGGCGEDDMTQFDLAIIGFAAVVLFVAALFVVDAVAVAIGRGVDKDMNNRD